MQTDFVMENVDKRGFGQNFDISILRQTSSFVIPIMKMETF